MVMSSIVLANQFAALPNASDEATAITNMTNAFITFFSDMSCAGIPCIPAVLQTTPKTTMAAAMVGLSTAGAASIQAGIIAFWGACVPLAATIFPTATLIVPPPSISTVAAVILPVGQASIAAGLDKVSACNAMAAAIYPLMLGGTATITVPPPTPLPIL